MRCVSGPDLPEGFAKFGASSVPIRAQTETETHGHDATRRIRLEHSGCQGSQLCDGPKPRRRRGPLEGSTRRRRQLSRMPVSAGQVASETNVAAEANHRVDHRCAPRLWPTFGDDPDLTAKRAKAELFVTATCRESHLKTSRDRSHGPPPGRVLRAAHDDGKRQLPLRRGSPPLKMLVTASPTAWRSLLGDCDEGLLVFARRRGHTASSVMPTLKTSAGKPYLLPSSGAEYNEPSADSSSGTTPSILARGVCM